MGAILLIKPDEVTRNIRTERNGSFSAHVPISGLSIPGADSNAERRRQYVGTTAMTSGLRREARAIRRHVAFRRAEGLTLQRRTIRPMGLELHTC